MSLAVVVAAATAALNLPSSALQVNSTHADRKLKIENRKPCINLVYSVINLIFINMTVSKSV